MSSLFVVIILVLFMAFCQFIGILFYKRFEKFCNKVKSKFVRAAPEPQEPVKKSTDLMDDI